MFSTGVTRTDDDVAFMQCEGVLFHIVGSGIDSVRRRTLRHRSKRRPAARSDSLEIIPPLFNREPSYVPGLIMHQAYDIPATNPETAGSCENFGLRIVHCGFGMKQ
jgi:hypothetical protein